MKCAPHGTERCPACKPAMAAMWTLDDLRRIVAETAHLPGGMPLVANVADPDDPSIADKQVITSAGPTGLVNWGDGYGDEPDGLFALDCHYPEAELLVKPDRPTRAAMGSTYLVETAPGATAREALTALRAAFRARYTDTNLVGEFDDDGPAPWLDLFLKGGYVQGYVQVWDKPVKDMATEWMRGWIAHHPPAGVDPYDKFGPWMTFPLESGGWMFFGWVNGEPLL